MTDSTPRPSRLLALAAVTAPWLLGLVLALWLLFGFAWGALHGWIVPRIGEFRPRIEAQLGKVLGVPVRIGAITAESGRLVPSFELHDVSLLDAQGREALKLNRIVALLSPKSLWRFGLDQLYIEQPELDVRRTRDGKILIAGLDISGNADSGAMDWVFSQAEVVVRNGTLRWTDEQRGAPMLALDQVDLVIRNSSRRHNLRLDATPPADWGQRFSLRATMRQSLLSPRRGHWREWDGPVYADFPQVDVSQLRRYTDAGADSGFELLQGRGAVRLWADLQQGEMLGGTADLQLADVGARLGSGLEPLSLVTLQGRMSGRQLAGGLEFSTQDLLFETAEGQRWPGGNVFLSFMRGESRVPGQGVFRADRLDLAALAQVAHRLPLEPAAREALNTYAPKGLVERVEASWNGRIEAPARYEVKGRIVQLELAAGRPPPPPAPTRAQPAVHHPAGRPGVRGMDVDFELTQAGGKATLQLQNGAMEFPGVFEEPVVPFDMLAGDIRWQVSGDRLAVQVPAMRFANADAQGDLQAKWHSNDGPASAARPRLPGVLELSGALTRAAGTRVHRYLPLAISERARHYVRDAVQQGSASSVKFRVKGDLHDFPYATAKQGEFNITAQVADVTYAYVPANVQGADTLPWPALTQLQGQLVFDHNAMQINGATGKFAGLPAFVLNRVDAEIADFGHSVVSVNADGRGPLGEMLGVVAGSPLAAMTGHALAHATGTGSADLKLQLALPLATLAQSKVQGSVVLAGSDVQITPDTPLLARARGTVQFSDSGFTLVGVQARALGGDVRLDGGSRPPSASAQDPTVVVRAQGTATAEGLRQASELGPVTRIAQRASGSAPYAVVLGVRRGAPEISVSSSLQGMAIDLPAPFAKAAEASLPLRVDNVLLAGTGTGTGSQPATQDQWTVELGRLLSAAFVRDISGPQPRLLRGAIGVGLLPGETAPMPEQGVYANVNLPSTQIDAWEAAFAHLTEPVPAVAKAAGSAGAVVPAATGATAANASAAYLPDRFALRAADLTVSGRKLHDLVLGGSRDGTVWRANVDARELNGYVEYRQPAAGSAGRVYARLARLTIAAGAETEVEQLLDQPTDSVPALDVVVDDFDLRGKNLGRVEMEAINRGAGGAGRDGVREWRLTKLNMTMPEATFTASGNWAAVNAQGAAAGGARGPRAGQEPRRTVMNFRLDVADAGALLGRFGMKGVFRQGKGSLEGQVSWAGSPLALDYPSLGGQFHVDMASGQFLKAEPGLAKLLGVLSLQSLPRRLTLDFRDVFSEGFAFDFVRGDVHIEGGIAVTNNLQMKGLSAAVLMEGRADIAHETQDIKVVVVPEINAGTASLVAGVINPAIGVGTFLAQLFLRRPLMEAATQQFHVDGTWADPRIARVARDRPGSPPADEPKTEALAPGKTGATP